MQDLLDLDYGIMYSVGKMYRKKYMRLGIAVASGENKGNLFSSPLHNAYTVKPHFFAGLLKQGVKSRLNELLH